MSPDPTQALIGQFTRFAMECDLNHNDWEGVAMEFGVHDTASNIHRFYRSWKWGDEDRQANTNKFLRKVAEEDQDIALGIMRRIYTKTARPGYYKSDERAQEAWQEGFNTLFHVRN